MRKEILIKKHHVLLANHIVLGKPILPAVGYFDIILRALQEEDSDSSYAFPWRITNAFWFTPLEVPGNDLAIDLEFHQTQEKCAYRVQSGGQGTPITYASGVISSAKSIKRQRAQNVHPDNLDKAPLQQLNTTEIYQSFDASGIIYRKLFQCLEEFRYYDRFSLGKLVRCSEMTGDASFPDLLDAAIQCVLLSVRQKDAEPRVFVPFSLDEIIVWEPPTSSCYAIAVFKERGRESSFFGFDVFLIDENDKILVEMKELCVKAFSPAVNGVKAEKPSSPSDEQASQWVVAATFTAEPIKESMGYLAEQLGWDVNIEFSPYNQIFQELLSPQSLLSQNRTGANFVLVRFEDLVSNVSGGLPEVSSAAKEGCLLGCERYWLPNGFEIGHLNSYETRYLYDEIFEKETYLKQGVTLREGDVVLDVGANIGMFSLFVAEQCSGVRIFAIEPSPIAFNILKQNLALYAPEATALQYGIADSDREADFVFYPRSSVFSGFYADGREDGAALQQVMENEIAQRLGSSDNDALRAHVGRMVDDRLQKEMYRCQLRSLSSLLKEHQIDKVDLLKIDAEKCEWDILKSIDTDDWKKISQIVVEVHDKKLGTLLEKIQVLLKEQGFEIAIVEEELLKQSGLYNIYARRPEQNRSIGRTKLERGIEHNLRDWVDLLKRTAKRRHVPLLIGICPPSPDMRSALSEAFVKEMEAWIEHELSGANRLKVLCFSNYEDIYDWGECYDPMRDAMGHIPYTPQFFSVMSSILMRHLHVMNRAPYKVIALDCDNTLWAGVVGEEGAEGIEIRQEFRALQQFMLRQKENGMLLCLVSKNSEDDVRRVFETRKDMVLKWEDIAGYRINWEPKSNNLQALSEFFDLSLDSFIFLDDSPVECAEVRAHCPAVLTLQLPAQAEIHNFIQHIWAFDHERQTAEDSQRTKFYQQMAKREQFRKGVASFADFIDGLSLDIRITEARAEDMKRIAQMTQRTNQFNFVKRVLTVADIEELSNAAETGCLVVRVADRFGEYGLCGLMIVSSQDEALKMDTFLLSCRVMGRGVEHAMMAALGREAEKRGKQFVEVTFVSSAKNRPAEQFLQEMLEAYPAEHEAGRNAYIFPASYLAEVVFTPLEIEADENTAFEAPAMQPPQNSDWVFMQRLGNERGVLGFGQEESVTSSLKQESAGAQSVSSADWQDHGVTSSPDTVRWHIESVVSESVGRCLRIESAAIDRIGAFSEYGVDSMIGIELIVMLNQTFDIVLPPTTLFDYTCINDLCEYIYDHHSEAAERLMKAMSQADIEERNAHSWGPAFAPEVDADKMAEELVSKAMILDSSVSAMEVAVIGLAGRFPGVSDVGEFWRLLSEGGSCITEVPVERWDIDAYYDPDREKPNKTYGRWGGFLEDIDLFDASFFGISGKEAQQMDPQQRLFLEESWHALEDAGYADRAIANKKWGVFVGADAGDYQTKMRQAGLPLEASSLMGNDASILAARIAYFMNLKGAALTLDTASSSSLTAVHMGCDSLRNGEVDLVIAGGVSIHTTPNFHILCSKAGMLSEDGKCKVFDDRADGFVPGEAVGIVVLKRLQDAVNDGDHVYGVIKGSGMNQDGRTNGITAPSSLSQTELIRSVYEKHEINAADIGYVEAHGTGTKLGDPIEIKALTDAFRNFTDKRQYCAIGSVKSNIGHSVHASGISALIKLLLSLQHKKIAPSIHFSRPNQHIPFEQSPFFVNTQLRDWQANSAGQRMGAVSSFGFSGTNVHMVVAEHVMEPSRRMQTASWDQGPFLFVLSAKSEERLRTYAEKFRYYLEGQKGMSPECFADLTYTLQVGREAMSYRLAIPAMCLEELLSRMDDFLRQDVRHDCLTGVVHQGRRSTLHVKNEEGYIQELTQTRQIGKLAELWVRGSRIDWTSLYASKRQRFHGLPTYPFEKDRYWLPYATQYVEPQSPAHAQFQPVSLKFAASSEASRHVVMSAEKRSLTPLAHFQQPIERLQQAVHSVRSSLVQWQDEGQGIFRIKASDPANRNRLSTPVMTGLVECFQAIQEKPEAKVVILSGEDSCFLSGGGTERKALFEQNLACLIPNFDLPIIAAMKGESTGMGWLLGSLCDFMVCDEGGFYQYHDTGSDWSPSEEERALFILRFGEQNAAQLLSSESLFAGQNLKDMGLLMTVVSRESVDDHAAAIARELSQSPREALVQLKRHLSKEIASQANKLSGSLTPLLVEKGDRQISGENACHEGWMQAGGSEVHAPHPGEPETIEIASDVVKAEVYKDGVLMVTLCDRQSKNTFTKAFVHGVQELFAHVRGNPRYKVVILTGYDHYFACGGTKETLLSIQEGTARFTDEKIFGLPLECEIPVIAAMQGHGIGPGWAMGMFCDDIIFSEESVYYSPYMRYGFTPGAGATLIFPNRLGKDLGREILFTAREYKGHMLRKRGIRMAVLPRSEVRSHALLKARRMALSSRDELVALKAARSQHLREQLEHNYALELAMHEITFVGNQEVQARIQRHFNLGMPDPSGQAASSEEPPQTTPAEVRIRLAKILNFLRKTLADELHLKPERIDDAIPFIDMGLDSITGVTWMRRINEHYGITLAATEAYNYPTLQKFADLVMRKSTLEVVPTPSNRESAAATPDQEMRPATPAETERSAPIMEARHSAPRKTQAIAVIGMSGRFPQSRNVVEFWNNLVQGRDCITEVPAERWSLDAFYDSNPDVPGKTYSKWMGVLEDVDKFDPLFFNISPREAELMDPQQRLFLEACWASVEDAGYAPSSLSGSRCGVFAGCGAGDYGMSLDAGAMNAQVLMGGAASILPARISYALNLQGPCLALDTACSSSLVAIAFGCDSLTAGNSDLVLAGGVTVLAGPAMHIMTSKAGMLSKDGRCFTFDQRANGFVPGEGVGVLLLKRLEDAERDGDIIHGVIRGWGVNQDGSTNGITAPNGDSQTRLQMEVYEKYHINPAEIQYVETHGTATKLGDPIEVEGLKTTFRHFTKQENFCALGAVKSNIGHALMAAGVAGTIKVLQALKHRQLPPTIHFATLNEHIALEGSPFYVNSKCKDWTLAEGQKRRAAVSSFGFSGTNAHLVIEEYEPAQRTPVTAQGAMDQPALIVLSAKNEERLKEVAGNLYAFLKENGSKKDAISATLDCTSIAYTLQIGREAMEERLGLIVRSEEELKEKLRAFLEGAEDLEDVYRGQVKRNKGTLAVFEADEDMAQMMDMWFRKRKYGKLLDLWVKGMDLSWNSLYGDAKPKRISLPAYPFARQRFWINNARFMAPPSRLEIPLQAVPTEPSSTLMCEPVWKEKRVSNTSPASVVAIAEHRIIACGFELQQAENLQAQEIGATCLRLHSKEKNLDKRFLEYAVCVLEEIQVICKSGPQEAVLIQIVVSPQEGQCLYRGLSGLLKTAHAENSKLLGQLIEVDEQAMDDNLLHKLQENKLCLEDHHVCYRDGKRLVISWEERALFPNRQ